MINETSADELDIVINIGYAKEHEWEKLEKEIHDFVVCCHGLTSKVIIETCYLTEEEKVEAIKCVKRAGATFVKTSTGFGTKGATIEDVKLMRTIVGPEMGVKAAGGIHSLQEAEAMVAAGATRIGASSGVVIMQELAKAQRNEA